MSNYQSAVIRQYLSLCGYSIPATLIDLEVQSHPDFSNLNAITESLKRIGIEATAARVEKSILTELEGSFLTFLVREGMPALVLVKELHRNAKVVNLVLDKAKQMQLSKTEFLEQWNGIIVVVDEHHQSWGERLNVVIPYASFLLLIGLLLLFFFTGQTTSRTIIFFSLSIAGVSVCTLIVAHELGSSITAKFCSEGKHSSCTAVLNSRASRIFKGVGLSDVGITYFSTVLVFLSVSSLDNSSDIPVCVAALFAFLAIPFTVFSVGYQVFVVKKFCPLCLSVVTLLWLQAITLYPYAGRVFSTITLGKSVLFVGITIAIFTAWKLIRPLLLLLNEGQNLLLENLTFRRSYELFIPWFEQAKPLIDEGIPELRLGNACAPVRLLAISNPMCGPCATAHRLYEQLMQKYPDMISLAIRFYVPLENRSDPRMVVAARLVELTDWLTPDQLHLAVHQWFSVQNFEEWIMAWGVPQKASSVEVLARQKAWCHSNNIDKTPTLLVNGIRMPNFYHPDDLVTFIDHLLQENRSNVFVREVLC